VQTLRAEGIALPGVTAPLWLDYLFFEPGRARVWIPAGSSGTVDVLDVAKHTISSIAGFKTLEREAHGKKRLLGPSSGAIGDRYAYIGNRATRELCSVDLASLKLRSCLDLPATPDGVEYCPSTRELWVTTPDARAIAVLDASVPGRPKLRDRIALNGEPEGYAIDEAHGLFLTNLEDSGSTLRIDMRSHQVKDTWSAGCASDGPRGIAVDSVRSMILVACTDHIQVLDAAHGGARLGKLDVDAGIDNIAYAERSGLLYVAAAKSGRLSVAHLDDAGQLVIRATGETSLGARNAVVDQDGVAYVVDGRNARLLVLRP